MENRNGLVVNAEVLPANGTAERDAALLMAEAIPGDHRVTLGADRNYGPGAYNLVGIRDLATAVS